MMRKAFALLSTGAPDERWCTFLESFTPHYDVYCVVDNASEGALAPLSAKFGTLTFVHVTDAECISAKFTYATFVSRRATSAWDKAVYYFSVKKQNSYDYVWFCEYDVFIPSVDTLLGIDAAAADADLVSKNSSIATNTRTWLWPRIRWRLPQPWLCGMMCINRMSTAQLQALAAHVGKYGRLFHLEASFPTVAHQAGLKLATPTELANIEWRREWLAPLKASHVYHPVKDIARHATLREQLE